MSKRFRGRVAGVTYTDATLFETAARACGYRPCKGNAAGRAWKVGVEVAFKIDGKKVRGQVWSQTTTRGWVWVALENGEFVAVHCRYATAHRAVLGAELGKAA